MCARFPRVLAASAIALLLTQDKIGRADHLVPAVGGAGALIIVVLDDVTRRPLPNAEVIDGASGRHRFTNERGESRLEWPESGRLTLRVRQLGYQFVEREVERRSGPADGADTVTFALQRLAVALPSMVTQAAGTCGTVSDSLSVILAAPALEQLRLGADRYEEFRKAYPFRIEQIRRTVSMGNDGKPKFHRVDTESADSKEWGERYEPGKVLKRGALGFSVSILFVSALADQVFWDNHCFTVRSVESYNGHRVVRLEFATALGFDNVEWQGAALLDSATSLLRKVEFQLTGMRKEHVPQRLEGFTTFSSPSPFIAVPESTLAIWWRHAPAEENRWGPPDVMQFIHVTKVEFRRAKPPPPSDSGELTGRPR